MANYVISGITYTSEDLKKFILLAEERIKIINNSLSYESDEFFSSKPELTKIWKENLLATKERDLNSIVNLTRLLEEIND